MRRKLPWQKTFPHLRTIPPKMTSPFLRTSPPLRTPPPRRKFPRPMTPPKKAVPSWIAFRTWMTAWRNPTIAVSPSRRWAARSSPTRAPWIPTVCWNTARKNRPSTPAYWTTRTCRSCRRNRRSRNRQRTRLRNRNTGTATVILTPQRMPPPRKENRPVVSAPSKKAVLRKPVERVCWASPTFWSPSCGWR